MAIVNWGRFIVRAEIQSSSERVVSYGFDLTESSIFVATEWEAAISTPVTVRLPFPEDLRADRCSSPDRAHPRRR